MDNLGVSIGAAVVAGGLLAATGVLQQRAASQRPADESLSPRLLLALARNRTWLTGLGTGVLSYAFQALALAFGPLALVQPIFLSELLFAVPVSVHLHHMHMHARAWIGVVAIPLGLAVGIFSAQPKPGDYIQPLLRWMIAIAAVAVVAGVAVLAGRRAHGPARASLFAFAAAAVMALQSGLLGATVALMKHSAVALFTAWQPYALIPATAVGVLLVESAYQAGPLAASMPAIDAVEPSVAIAIGVTLFGEHVRLGALPLAGTAVGLVAFFVGIVLLDTSPVVHALQGRQEAVQSDADPGAAAEARAGPVSGVPGDRPCGGR